MQLQIAAAIWQIKTRSNSAFSQTTLDLLQAVTHHAITTKGPRQ